jgi:hypothetical protein
MTHVKVEVHGRKHREELLHLRQFGSAAKTHVIELRAQQCLLAYTQCQRVVCAEVQCKAANGGKAQHVALTASRKPIEALRITFLI